MTTTTRPLPRVALAISLWILCLGMIATQLTSALDRCTLLWTMLRSQQAQAVVVGAAPGLRVETRAWVSEDRQRVVAVAVDAAGCIRLAGATESAEPETAALRIYLRPVLQAGLGRDCMSKPLP